MCVQYSNFLFFLALMSSLYISSKRSTQWHKKYNRIRFRFFFDLSFQQDNVILLLFVICIYLSRILLHLQSFQSFQTFPFIKISLSGMGLCCIDFCQMALYEQYNEYITCNMNTFGQDIWQQERGFCEIIDILRIYFVYLFFLLVEPSGLSYPL